MATLYEINQGILECLDAETGEILDFEKLSELQLAKQDKIEGVALYIKNLQALITALDAEEKAFAERKKQAKAKVDGLKMWLVKATEGEKFITAKCAISFRKSESVEIEDEALIPKKYLAKTITYKPDKNAIKELLKAGHKIKGCTLAEKLNAQIK